MKNTVPTLVRSMESSAGIDRDTPTLRLFALLEVIASKDHFFTLQGLVEETGLPKPTLHRMLQQLESAGMLQREAMGVTMAPACACAVSLKT